MTFEPTSSMCVLREQPVLDALLFCWRFSNCHVFRQNAMEKVLVSFLLPEKEIASPEWLNSSKLKRSTSEKESVLRTPAVEATR